MLDVHAPEHRISGLRDFLLHLFTITCGLLIALALENAAEALHHRSERKEAERIIRQELKENEDMVIKAGPVLAGEIKALQGMLAFIEARSEGSKEPPAKLATVNFNDAEIQDAAWRTASSTGVLAYMDYGEVEKFSAAYREQELLQKEAEQTVSDYLQMLSVLGAERKDPNQLTTERASLALPYVRRSLADLYGVLAYGNGTAASCQEALR